ncbi:MAG: peptide chain release factor 1 [Candidatus Andersenbacteria bacterium RIFCSPHIGHO2_12_FULL_45_11b]|uniref:Peptide chain release factor 1 n=1 Tax=Candidatus Andersenbacteria bacterium RIFCSPHIGHO2_12_FULL_45_11b TaxID=1797282 RepID=A0A1G1XCA5_9BACT|nr:MAG: peptide chain release factor 1 [Candidatus Andersenbacteria bacterium RIFCSPHIGHO2_12_FULL_45_11b]
MNTPSEEALQQEIDSLTQKMSDPAAMKQASIIKELSHSLRHAREVLEATYALRIITEQLNASIELANSSEDEDMKALAQEDINTLAQKKSETENKLEELLIPEDPRNSRDVILEIRAGAGGDEAGLFAGELLRAYMRYAEVKGWKISSVSQSEGEHGGIKEAIVEISGEDVYGHLKFESGVHRVQRIPTTEKMGRVHTSTITVAILPRAEEVDIEIKPEDLRIDTYRASGAGGQHVNKTSSAIRITHIPTNIMVACQQERSQHKNRDMAMSLLRAKLLAKKEEEVHAKEASARKAQIGTADRSEKIRTYNFPQDRVTDHRIKQSWSGIELIMEGALDPIFTDIRNADRELRLAAAG